MDKQQITKHSKQKLISLEILCLITALYITAIFNRHMLGVITRHHAAETAGDYLFLCSAMLSIALMITLYLLILCYGKTGKWLLAIIVTASAAISYIRDQYNVVFDETMIQNIIETDVAEASELLSINWALFLTFLGLVPASVIIKCQLKKSTLTKALIRRTAYLCGTLILLIINILPFYQDYASVLRTNRELKNYIIPTAYVYSTYKYAINHLPHKERKIEPIGEDAKIVSRYGSIKKMALVFVVGETARAENFSLSGYSKNTNPLIAQRINNNEDLVYFGNFSSCGTSTAISLPCMFSNDSKNDFNVSDAKYREGLLDVFAHAGLDVVWIDNNSGCKGACNRITYIDTRKRKNEPSCNKKGCFDDILVKDLNTVLNNAERDIVVVLHQKGSHGPAYYARTPKKFKQFQPECKRKQLQECTQEEIINAYDNTILYTDYILNKTIDLLKKYNDQFDSAMLYASDHGESLGEHGLYLHGMPYSIAPSQQTHVPAMLWLSEGFSKRLNINTACLKQNKDEAYSHDNLFHTLLGLMEIKSQVYDQALDIIQACQ